MIGCNYMVILHGSVLLRRGMRKESSPGGANKGDSEDWLYTELDKEKRSDE